MVSAVVLAAGLSRRMGTNKLLLPFGEGTVLSHIVSVLQACPLDEIVVVTGHEHEKIEEMLGRYVGRHPHDGPGGLRFVYNPNYAMGEMLSSIQAGLMAMRRASHCDAALIVLGDQPHIERRIVDQVIAAHESGIVVIPSFNRRGGHPILIDRACWPEVLALPLSANLREALHAHADWLRYVEVDTETILRDVDTPEDYERAIR
jgi:molybdenum cofactor cytidylyltransferase